MPMSQNKQPDAWRIEEGGGGIYDRRVEALAQARRNWIARSGTTVLIAGLVLFSVIVIRRDQYHRDRLQKSLTAYVQPLQEIVTRTKYLPSYWDVSAVKPSPPVPIDRFSYISDTIRECAEHSDQPVLVAWTEAVIPMVFGADGRVVAVLHKGEISVKWVTEREYARYVDEQHRLNEKLHRGATQAPK